mmetsp:Transcript_45392/g.97308  ORF Transcript_45392/g.97308 Transcript_45392/m.97308 type:complete len:133 (+) Transcript_45392:69-467(+)|eukprot:CAMPEP_0206455324 /NCGR_PEP_ID=MMETSP0324_2-20121206/21681_1 /ASSEMBLY_ACC=CAM_ASM_000836 /TAXON_ID=2866 /ORGANISM="Crypthecodinium cohnii, Strain Seligo" /LENGTH=132 /DNA_ID=CAMNT_0053925999 /DNA_START=48 /DNA_END=446 /DNA_ORIENTATION=+
MVVKSRAQLKHEKAVVSLMKVSRKSKLKAKKAEKKKNNRDRHEKKKQLFKTEMERGREGAPDPVAGKRSSKLEGVLARLAVRKQRKAKAVKAGKGSGTVGARSASAQVPKWTVISKHGARRHKPTWHHFGKK